MNSDEMKRLAALEAVKLVEADMTVGLGTGSTAAHFVDLLGERVREGLTIRGVPTSDDTRQRALGVGIDLVEPDETTVIDLAVDGTDEVDLRGHLIKGGGGALLREKIIASSARRFVVIADRSKRVAELGAFPLPIEIDSFAYGLTVRRIRETLAAFDLPGALRLRPGKEGAPFISDGGHYIVDCALERIHDPAGLERALARIAGVVETGLFISMCEMVILGGPDGVEVFNPASH